MGLSLQFPLHVTIFFAFLLAKITDVSMSLQDQAYSKGECGGR